ncbi:MAG: DUF748 domain-containing protein [Rhodoferax sp.]|jgi:uncharacterized protein involved in outer membrane biogenesis|nr:DUF748 domain-containing protein [Rhodoferax sp.]
MGMKLDTLFQNSISRRLSMAIGAVLLLWAVTWVAVPPLLKSQAQSRLTELLGRQVAVGAVNFKPWSLELEVSDFTVAQAGTSNAPAQLAIQRFYVDLEMQSLFRLAPVVDALQMESPRLRLKHLGGGRYDIDDILQRLNQGPAEPDAKPLHFALYNLVLSQGEVVFDDAPIGKVHNLRELTLKLPFLSNLDSKREVLTQPLLAFDLNGSKFDSHAQSTPFAPDRKTQAHIQIPALDLAPYLGYLPPDLPVRLTSAVLHADLTVDFEQTPQASVGLSGSLAATQVKLASNTSKAMVGGSDGDLLSFEALKLQLKGTRPLARQIRLESLELVRPVAHVGRDKSGQLNWQALGKPGGAKTSSAHEKAASDEDKLRALAQKDANSSPWAVAVASVKLQDGLVRWADASMAKPVQLDLSQVNLSVTALKWPFEQAAPFEGSAMLDKAGLRISGNATDVLATVNAKLTDLPLNAGAAYLAQFLKPRLDGVLNAELALTWRAARAPDQPGVLTLSLPNLTLDNLALTQTSAGQIPAKSQQPLASIKSMQLENVAVDVPRQSISLGQVRVMQPKTGLKRFADGHWMVDNWLVKASPLPHTARPRPPVKPVAAEPSWQVTLADLNLTQGDLTFADASTAKSVAFDLSAVNLNVKQLTWPARAKSKPASWTLAARMHQGQTEPGTLSGRGTASLSPVHVQANLAAQRLPMHAFAPYLASVAKLDLLRADTSFKGRVDMVSQANGLALQVKGDLKLEDLRVDTLAQPEPFKPAEELLSWKDLSLGGLVVVMQPGQAPQIEVGQTSLSDFFAKLTLSETGRLNLQDVTASEANPAGTPAPTVSLAANAGGSTHTATLPATSASKNEASSPDDKRASAAIDAQDGMAPVVKFGPVSLTNGRVDFNDRFIKPNYSARLSELTGKLSAFSSVAEGGQVQLADLELRGRVEGTASLEILGKVNPLAKPVALDIQGRVRDLELAPLSTYSARYAGYGIERGKLSVDVAYKVQPAGQLTASNNIVLNQLKFGDKVPGAENSLPVKLAVALLADRNGVIDIDLPVSGSLNDPQFRLGPIVFKLIVNLIVKAVTAPFSLLASALGGGGDELSMVSFAPGSAVLSTEAKAGLDKVAKALEARPALKMTVVGTASLDVEREGFKREQLQALLLAEKRRARGTTTDADTPSVTPQEYPLLLKAVYKRADFPKPRNLIGLTKDLPGPEMEALLLTNLPATEATMQDLAVKRGVVVRDYLASLKLPLERLFLGAAKAVPPEAKWRPRAELNLASE